MHAQLRPRVESLEGRMLLSTVERTAMPVPVTENLTFVAPGTTTTGVHAIVSQQASSVTLTVHLGYPGQAKIRQPTQVEVTTGPFTTHAVQVPLAQPGVQYQPVDQTVTFPPGVTSEQVTIPIVAGAANPGMLAFEVTATQLGVKTAPYPQDGQATEDVFVAGNSNAPAPKIDGAHMVVSGQRTSDFVLHFSQPMDPASVQNLGVYYLNDTIQHWHWDGFGNWLLQGFPDGGGRSYTTQTAQLKTATYDPSTNTVDLHLAKPVDARDVYQIGQSILPEDALLDAEGTPINEDGSGLGGNFLVTLGRNKATIFDGVTQSVVPVTSPRR